MASAKNQTKLHSKNTNMYLIGVLFVAVLALIIGGLKLYKHTAMQKNSNYTTQNQMATTPPNAIQYTANSGAMKNWKTYTDHKYQFSMKYPSTWSISEPRTFSDNQMNLPAFMNNNYGVSFTINNLMNTKLSPLFVSVIVNENPEKWTTAQWLNTIEKNSGRSIQNQRTNIFIDNQPAISERQNPDFEDIFISYSSKNPADYTMYSIGFGGNGEGQGNYQDSDPFVQQELTNFHTAIATLKFPQ